MATKPKKRLDLKKMRPKPRGGRFVALAIWGLLSLAILAMHIQARTVHVRYAEVEVADLPAAFDGVKVLYVSDVDMCGLNTPGSATRLFDRLQGLQPDILLLGGDYTSPNLFQRLNGGASGQSARKKFFASLADFQAPLGKFAITGDNDGDAGQFALTLVGSGVEPLDGRAARIEFAGANLYLAGVGWETQDVNALAAQFQSDQCVIALAHTPDRVADIRISEANGGGVWADLILTGHTHGGQMRLFGRSILTLTEREKETLYGWYDGEAPLLVTSGAGCESVNLRLGTQSEVWLIQLKTKL